MIKIPNKKVEGWALPEMPGGSVQSVFATLINAVFVHLLCRFLPRVVNQGVFSTKTPLI